MLLNPTLCKFPDQEDVYAPTLATDAAEGTNVVAESFTDDKCTVVATGVFMKKEVFTGKDLTETKMEDSKTVIKVEPRFRHWSMQLRIQN